MKHTVSQIIAVASVLAVVACSKSDSTSVEIQELGISLTADQKAQDMGGGMWTIDKYNVILHKKTDKDPASSDEFKASTASIRSNMPNSFESEDLPNGFFARFTEQEHGYGNIYSLYKFEKQGEIVCRARALATKQNDDIAVAICKSLKAL